MTEKTTKTPQSTQQPDTLSLLALIFGIVSLLGPGLLLGIPAIILAGIALKKNLPGRGLSIAGLVTGIISTVFSFLALILAVLLFSWAINTPDTFYDNYYYPQHEQAPAYHGSRT